jgi:diketogulonate reductase-like aldo/keto reductase
LKRVPDSFAPEIKDGKMVPDLVDLNDTWKAMEQVYNKGLVKAIGVSNFNAKQIQHLYDKATVKPHNLQVIAYSYLQLGSRLEGVAKRFFAFYLVLVWSVAARGYRS